MIKLKPAVRNTPPFFLETNKNNPDQMEKKKKIQEQKPFKQEELKKEKEQSEVPNVSEISIIPES